MSKHAEFEASLRELPQIELEKLKTVKQKTLKAIKDGGKTLEDIPKFGLLGIEVDGSKNISGKIPTFAGALCLVDPTLANNCNELTETAINNLCLAESSANGGEPRFVCDTDWIENIGADGPKISKFISGYEKWKKTFLTSVKWLLQSQAGIKLKRNVSVPLGYRQVNADGEFLDKVHFEENAWNKAFSKLQPSTKISEQSLWLLAFLFHTDRVEPTQIDDGLQEICTFVGRSMEVRTDDALSSLKILAYNPILLKKVTIETFDDFANEELIAASMKYGNPHYFSRLLEKKPTLTYGNEAFNDGLFLAMHEDNQILFDFLLKATMLNGETPANGLAIFALNSIKFKNNDAYFLKLLAASGKSFYDFIPGIIAKFDDYTNLVQNFERRLVLRNPFINKLSIGNKADNEEFLKKVKRFYSKGVL